MSEALNEAWNGVLAQLEAAGARVEVLTEGRPAVERAEGYRFLTRVLAAMGEFSVEADADWPVLMRVMSPTRKFYGDCPDTIYHRASLRGGREYRVWGRRGEELYLAFCVYGLRGKGTAILANVSDAEMEFGEDGSFELVLSAERPTGATNWLPLEATATTLVTRQYFANWREEVPADLNIERLGTTGPPPEPDADGMVRRLRAMGESVARTLKATELASAEWVARPNEVSIDSSAAGLAGLFATPDNRYVGGWYRLAENEALVITGRAPRCRYWGAQLWSRWLESRDYLNRSVCLNHSQMTLEPDGSYRIVVAHRDPGISNWLDTGGHTEGGVVFRWLQAEEEPMRPVFTLENI